MDTLRLLLIFVAAVGGTWLVLRALEAARIYFLFRGKRLVRCPATKQSEAVEVSAGRAAWRRFLGRPGISLNDCSRWASHPRCSQACVGQIESAPEECLVRGIVAHWYQGKSCVLCGRPFTEIRWHDHAPALRDYSGITRQWSTVPPEKLLEVLATHRPVCWSCHVAESFRSSHPELVVDRPPHSDIPVSPLDAEQAAATTAGSGEATPR